MTIKELERRTGLPRTSIRFYEQEGLLTPERRENNYRDYSEDNVRTLEKIKLLRRLSLDLEAIRRLQAGELSLSRALAGQALAGLGGGPLRPGAVRPGVPGAEPGGDHL